MIKYAFDMFFTYFKDVLPTLRVIIILFCADVIFDVTREIYERKTR